MAITPSEVDVTPGAGAHISTVDVVNGGNTDRRQVMCVGGPDSGDLSTIASVLSSQPVGTEKALAVRQVGITDPDVTAAVSITTATPGAGNTSQLISSGRKSYAVQISGTWVGTLVFEVNIDPTNTGGWIGVDVWQEASESYVSSATTNGSWWFEPVGAVGAIRVRATAWSSGTATGLLLASTGDMNTPEYMGSQGTAVPPNMVQVGGSDGTNIRAIKVSTAGVVSVDASVAGVKPLPDSTSTFAPTGVDSSALEASHILKASAGVLHGITGYNNRTSAQFIQVHNTATLPADSSVPLITFVVPPQSNFSFDTGRFGKFFATGITICNSSTVATKTIGSADCWFNALIT